MVSSMEIEYLRILLIIIYLLCCHRVEQSRRFHIELYVSTGLLKDNTHSIPNPTKTKRFYTLNCNNTMELAELL